MLNYKIEGGHLPVLICQLEPGQTLCTERGSMSWMSPNMKMETNSGGGFKKALGRLFAGESIFLNEYTPQGGQGLIAFASSFPGSILPFEITPGHGIVVQKKGFLAMEKGLELSVFFQNNVGKGLFGGEGFIMQRISGTGLAFIEIDGHCVEYELGAGQSIVIDTGYLAAMSETCTLDIRSVQGAKNVFFGGEGLFNTIVTGPGRVYLQTMPAVQMADALAPYISVGGGSKDGDGISINLGGRN